MQKIEYLNEIYYYNNYKFFDSSFIEVDTTLARDLAVYLFSKRDYSNYNQDQIFDFAKETKEVGIYSLSKDVCMYGLLRFQNEYFIRAILPILSSALRMLNEAQLAVEICEDYMARYKCMSAALPTSLAAAYCDIKDYANARKYANMAYSKQGGSAGYPNELSLVYMRIKKESGE